MNRLPITLCLLSNVGIVVGYHVSSAVGESARETPSIEEIDAAWTKRAAEVSTVKLVFRERRTSVQPTGRSLRNLHTITRTIPRQVFYARGGKMRFESVLIGPDELEKHFTVSNGDHTRSLNPRNKNGIPQGIIWKSRHLDGGGMIVAPIVMLYLPQLWSEVWDLDIERMRVRSEPLRRGDRALVALVERNEREGDLEVLVDPARDFLPIELVRTHEGRIARKTVIKYESGSGTGLAHINCRVLRASDPDFVGHRQSHDVLLGNSNSQGWLLL